jgi:histidine phosphotransferase ChpT
LRGGTLSVAAEPGEGGIELAVRAEGPRLLLDPELRAALNGEGAADALTPRAAAAYLVHLLLSEANSELRIFEPQDGVLVFGAKIPA